MGILDKAKRVGTAALIMVGAHEIHKGVAPLNMAHDAGTLSDRVGNLIIEVPSSQMTAGQISEKLNASKAGIESLAYRYGNETGDDIMSAYNRAVASLGKERWLPSGGSDSTVALDQINALGDLMDKIRSLSAKANEDDREIILVMIAELSGLLILLATYHPTKQRT